jgi:predicted nuclease with TOPRIM domain
MSEENKVNEGSKADGEHQKADVNEVMKRIEQLESTNKRLLDESKSWKNQATDFKSKLDENEKNKVAQSGDDKQLLEYEKKQREKIEGENKKLKAKTLDQAIKNVVGKYAKDAHNIDDVLNQPQFGHILKAGIDAENLTVDETAAKDFVNAVFEAKPYMRKNSQQAGVDSSRPKTSAITGANLDNVKKGEHKEIIKAALSKW